MLLPLGVQSECRLPQAGPPRTQCWHHFQLMWGLSLPSRTPLVGLLVPRPGDSAWLVCDPSQSLQCETLKPSALLPWRHLAVCGAVSLYMFLNQIVHFCGEKRKETASGTPTGVCGSTWVQLTLRDSSDSCSQRLPLISLGCSPPSVILEEEALTFVCWIYSSVLVCRAKVNGTFCSQCTKV